MNCLSELHSEFENHLVGLLSQLDDVVVPGHQSEVERQRRSAAGLQQAFPGFLVDFVGTVKWHLGGHGSCRTLGTCRTALAYARGPFVLVIHNRFASSLALNPASSNCKLVNLIWHSCTRKSPLLDAMIQQAALVSAVQTFKASTYCQTQILEGEHRINVASSHCTSDD